MCLNHTTAGIHAGQLAESLLKGEFIMLRVWIPADKERKMVTARVLSMSPESGNKDKHGRFHNWNCKIEIFGVSTDVGCNCPGCMRKLPRTLTVDTFVCCDH